MEQSPIKVTRVTYKYSGDEIAEQTTVTEEYPITVTAPRKSAADVEETTWSFPSESIPAVMDDLVIKQSVSVLDIIWGAAGVMTTIIGAVFIAKMLF